MSKSPFEEKYALTDIEMLKYCKKHDIPASMITLEEYNESPDSLSKFQVIFTGSTANTYNTVKAKTIKKDGKEYEYEEQPITHHWLGGIGNIVFDSYGYYDDYTWPENTEFVHTVPRRLQEFNSNVCGLYVLSFLSFCKNKNPDYENLGRDYSIEYGFSNDRNENDNIVIKWYDETK